MTHDVTKPDLWPDSQLLVILTVSSTFNVNFRYLKERETILVHVNFRELYQGGELYWRSMYCVLANSQLKLYNINIELTSFHIITLPCKQFRVRERRRVVGEGSVIYL